MNKGIMGSVFACVLTGIFLVGCSTPAPKKASEPVDKTVYYTSLLGVPGWQENVKVTKVSVLSNEFNLPAVFTIMPLADLKLFCQPNPYMPPTPELTPFNCADIADTIALVCTYTAEKECLITSPHISGVSHVPKKMSTQMLKGDLYPIVCGGNMDKLIVSQPRSSGGLTISGPVLAMGTPAGAKNIFVLFLPDIPNTYDVSFSSDSEVPARKITVKLEP